MFNNSYDKTSEMSTHVPAPRQGLSSYSSRGVSDAAAAGIPSSGLGSQYDFFQPDIQYRDFGEGSHASSFRHPIPLVPGNADYTGGIYPPHREQFPPNVAAASSHWGCGSQPAMPYGQPGPMNPNTQGDSERPWEPGASFTGHPAAPTVSTCPPNFEPPRVHAWPNAQGILAPTWQLSQSWIDYEGGEDLRLIILFKKIQST